MEACLLNLSTNSSTLSFHELIISLKLRSFTSETGSLEDVGMDCVLVPTKEGRLAPTLVPAATLLEASLENPVNVKLEEEAAAEELEEPNKEEDGMVNNEGADKLVELVLVDATDDD